MPSRRPIEPRAGGQTARVMFKRGAETREAWHMVASELERAAELLWDQHDRDMETSAQTRVADSVPPLVQPAALLLAALAVENLLKGNLITIKPALDAAGRFAHKTHRLLDLVEFTQTSVTKEEHDLIERL